MNLKQNIPLAWLRWIFVFLFISVWAISWFFYSSSVNIIEGSIAVLTLGILFSFFDTWYLQVFLFFLLPFSINLGLDGEDLKMFLPTEPLLAVIAIDFVIRCIYYGSYSHFLSKNSIVIFVFIYLISFLISTLTSTIYLVSLKYSLVTYAYVFVYFFHTRYQILKRNRNPLQLFTAYLIGLTLVIIFTTVNYGIKNFSASYATTVAQPFYSDHAIYSVCATMLISFAFYSMYTKFSFRTTIIFLLVCSAILLSYSRASWVGVTASAVLFLLLLIKVRLSHLTIVLFISGILVWAYEDDIIVFLKTSRAQSHAKMVSLQEQAESITNITNDVSNEERINRWSCAYRMFADKPILGFGPGTYQFKYFDYQRPDEMTRISVTSPYHNSFGKGGSAHSEYFLISAENGLIGLIAMLGFFFAMFYYAFTSFRIKRKITRALIICVCCSLVAYLTHSLFNNFLNVDKAAGLFWAFLAVLSCVKFLSNKTSDAA